MVDDQAPIPWYQSQTTRLALLSIVSGLLGLLKALSACPKIFGTPICEYNVDRVVSGVLAAGALAAGAGALLHRIRKGKDPASTDKPLALTK